MKELALEFEEALADQRWFLLILQSCFSGIKTRNSDLLLPF